MTSSFRLGLVNYHAWCLQVNVTDLLRTLGDFEFVNRRPTWKQSMHLEEWEHIYIHGDGVSRRRSESYCTLLYGNSLIKAGSHTVELFSDFSRNLCTAHQTLCVSPSDCCGCLQTSRRNHARSSHANHQKPITRAILRTTTHLCHSWSTDVTPTIQTHLLTHFRTNINC